MASARACSIPPSKLLHAALRPPDLESDVTAGTKAASAITIMPITTRSSRSVNPREQPRSAKVEGWRSKLGDRGTRMTRRQAQGRLRRWYHTGRHAERLRGRNHWFLGETRLGAYQSAER